MAILSSLQGSTNCGILQSQIGEHWVSLENMEKEMFSGSPTEMPESSPTQVFSGFSIEVFSPIWLQRNIFWNTMCGTLTLLSQLKTVLDKGGGNSDQ